jgi:hypothetical protein
MRILFVILLAAALGAGCGGDKKAGGDKAAAKKDGAAKPPAGLKPMGASPHAAAGGGLPPGHGGMGGSGEMPALPTPEAPKGMSFEGIAKAEAGQTIEELYAQRADLAGKVVKVRGRIVKFSPEIMGTNWAHVQDGTGAAGTNDLTVTTSEKANVGDLVLVEGPLSVDETLGHGMKYTVLVQSAKLVVEKKD